MKKIFVVAVVFILSSFAELQDPLTQKERTFASDFLTGTENDLIAAVKGLSEAQLKFKAAPDRWSVEDCVKHIAMSEMGIWHMTDSIINSTANPEKRSDVKATDEQVISMLSDRSHKLKAPEELKPQNTPFKSMDEALESFKGSRNSLISYVGQTDKDLRNHVVAFPMGSFDTYQMILFIGSHSKRHTKQILEVKADPAFPKN